MDDWDKDNPRSPEFCGTKNLINRVEFIRVIEQALVRLGFRELANQLEAQSGVDMQPSAATSLRDAVLAGMWDEALQLLPELSAGEVNLKQAQFLVLRQKYLECIKGGDTEAALSCLRFELQPLEVNQKVLHGLTGMLLQPSSGALNNQSTQLGADIETSRESVLSELCTHLPPSLLLPDGRLEELVEQALLFQLEKCQFHNTNHLRMTLFADYQAGLEQLPTILSQVLDNHTDEVWALQFSQSGRHLASASKDGSVILWSVTSSGEVNFLRYVWRGECPMNLVAFSPSDDALLVAGNDNVVRLFGLEPNGLQQEYHHHKDAITACCWFPDGRHFLTAGHDYAIYIVDLNGRVIRTIPQNRRLYDAILSRDGSTVISVGQDKKIHLLRLDDNREVAFGEGPSAITCLSASSDGRYMLANMQSNIIHMWPLGDMAHPSSLPSPASSRPGGVDPLDAIPVTPLQEFRIGEAAPSRYVIRSTLGGAGCSFVASGSEDCKVYIWHRDSGTLLHALEGHAGTVNAVSWNSSNQYMLASASDDNTIRIWVAKAGMEYRQ